MSLRQEFDTVDVLKLQVENDWPGLPNLVWNPTGELSAAGWHGTGSTTAIAPISGPAFRYSPVTFAVDGVLVGAGSAESDLAEILTVPAVSDAQARGQVRRVGGTIGMSAHISFYDKELGLISSGPETALLSTDDTVLDVPAVTMPEDTKFVALVITGTSTSVSDYVDFTDACLVTGTPTQVAVTPVVEPGWVDVLGSSMNITVDRPGFDVGTLVATIRDSTLDPSHSTTVRKGKQVQLLARRSDTSAWERIFTGDVLTAKVTYDLLVADPARRAKIALTAVDLGSVLANIPQPNGVGTVEELPFILDSRQVPWNVNGSRSCVSDAQIVAVSDGATAFDQVVLTRDTLLAYAWASRFGVLVVADPDHMSTVPAATFDDAYYTDLDLDYDSEACINYLTVNLLSIDPESGDTVTTVFGPYSDGVSIRENGKHDKTVTIQGQTTETGHGPVWDQAAVDAYAYAILAANAYPELTINGVTAAVTEAADFAAPGKVFRDLYDLVGIANSVADLAGTARITSISHSITPTKWLITYSLTGSVRVASLQKQPPGRN